MSPSFRILISVFLAAACSLCAKPNATRIELYYGIAEGNYLIGDLKGAAKSVEQMLKLDADYVPALTLNTRIKIDQGEHWGPCGRALRQGPCPNGFPRWAASTTRPLVPSRGF